MSGGNARLQYPAVNVPQKSVRGSGYGPLLHGPEGTASHPSMRRKQDRVGQGTHQRLHGAGALIVMTADREAGAAREQASQTPVFALSPPILRDRHNRATPLATAPKPRWVLQASPGCY